MFAGLFAGCWCLVFGVELMERAVEAAGQVEILKRAPDVVGQCQPCLTATDLGQTDPGPCWPLDPVHERKHDRLHFF